MGGKGDVILEMREERVLSIAEVYLGEEEVNKLVTCPCARGNGARP
jgi:hypothetical protein